jgi:broad specificity phosphatase PhoE
VKEVYLIRHGATLENKARLLVGLSDPPLDEDERVLLESVKVSINPDVIFSSPLRRASSTATLLFPGRDIIYDSNLVERSFGELEGTHIEIIGVDEKGNNIYSHRDEATIISKGGESLIDLESRITGFLKRLKEIDGKLIVVVSHGTLISHMVRILLKEEKPRSSPRNLNVVHFFLDNDGTVSKLSYDKTLNQFIK